MKQTQQGRRPVKIKSTRATSPDRLQPSLSETVFSPARQVLDSESHHDEDDRETSSADQTATASTLRRETYAIKRLDDSFRRETVVLKRSALPTTDAKVLSNKSSSDASTSAPATVTARKERKAGIPVLSPLLERGSKSNKSVQCRKRTVAIETSRLPRSMQKVVPSRPNPKRHTPSATASQTNAKAARVSRQQQRRQQHNMARDLPDEAASDNISRSTTVTTKTVKRVRRSNKASPRPRTQPTARTASPLPSSPAVRRQRGEALVVKALKSVQLPAKRLPAAGEDEAYARRVEALLASTTDENELKALVMKRTSKIQRSPVSGNSSLTTSMREEGSLNCSRDGEKTMDTTADLSHSSTTTMTNVKGQSNQAPSHVFG
eukprot:TRINITY_DN10215_c0_g3_i1.p1 TRINITY_DN10215_c0_g3~~TRINITY_DN10215_c0_g3_i1.p1  ORF type:complete len:378 (+),score=95.00 TRINITY_DN10215_c0_g3_i1:455-1588(+)